MPPVDRALPYFPYIAAFPDTSASILKFPPLLNGDMSPIKEHIMQPNPISPLLAELLKQYPPVLDLEQGAQILKYPTVNSVRLAFCRGRLPVRLRSIGGRYVFFLSDIVEFLETGQPQEQILKPHPTPAPTAGKRPGRPTKAQQIARRQAEA
ncbi:MAG: hypothetical protein K2P57_02570 [Burkholderiales bacterium]|nr:hypothetical protein [Burkholderiales bacterium]